MHDIAPVDQDRHAARLSEDVAAGRLTAAQAVRLAMAMGRVQGSYMGAIQLAHEAGIVCQFNGTRQGRKAATAVCVRANTGRSWAGGNTWRVLKWFRMRIRRWRLFLRDRRR